MIFATLNADQVPVELAPGQAFTTYRVVVSTEQEAAWSLTPIGGIASFELNHSPGSLEALSPEECRRFLIQKVELPEPPAGQRLAGYTLALEDGVITAEATFEPLPPPPVPQQVSRMQAKLALLQADLLDDVEAAIAGASREVQIYWAEVSELHRDHTILTQMTTALGWTSEQVDDLFRTAAAIF